MRHHPIARPLSILAVFALLALSAGCSGSSPTEPSPTPAPTPAPPTGSFSVTVTSSLAQLPVNGADPTILTVHVLQSNGQAPPNGTTAVLSTSLGNLSTVGGAASVAISLTGGTAQVPMYAGSIVGTAIVQAQISGVVGQTTVAIVGAEDFFISFVAPATGSPAGGDTVTIHGGGFATPVRVSFNGINVQVVSSDSTQIRVVTPPSTAAPTATLTVSVSVTIRANQSDAQTDTLTNAFTYMPGSGGSGATPQIFSLTPVSGPNEGGTHVTIVGTGFEAPVQVLFGQGTSPGGFQGLEATILSVESNRLVVVTPAARGIGQDNLNQTVNVLVRNLNTGFAAIATSAFRYGTTVLITAATGGPGDYRGGDLITIFGQGFEAPAAVQFGSVPQFVISVTDTEIVVRTSAVRVTNCAVDEPGFSNNSGTIHEVNINTGDGADGPDFTYFIPQPLIFNVSPTHGNENGGTQVLVSGTGFEPPTRVLFGSQAASVSAESETLVTVHSPVFTGTFPEQACQVDGMDGSRFTPVAVNVVLRNLLTGCTDTLSNGFVYDPSDPSCRIPTTPP